MPTEPAQKKDRSKTDDNGNAMLQNILSKLFKKENSGKYSRSAAVGKMGKRSFLLYYLFTWLHATALGH